MKTLKFGFALLILSGLAISNLFGQSPVRDILVKNIVVPFPCTDQILAGDLTIERTLFNNHVQTRIYGIMIGSTDGCEYFFDGINNISDKGNWDEFGQEAITYTWPGNYHIYKNGKLAGTVFFAFHYTVNANGVWSAYRGDVYEYTCVGAGRIK